mgnify:CR=1 FL=1
MGGKGREGVSKVMSSLGVGKICEREIEREGRQRGREGEREGGCVTPGFQIDIITSHPTTDNNKYTGRIWHRLCLTY